MSINPIYLRGGNVWIIKTKNFKYYSISQMPTQV